MHTQAMDAKLNRITNGERMGLDYIEVPKGEWFVSEKSGELYHYHSGVFEAYSMKKDKHGEYSTHHVLKVIPDDAVQVEI